MPDKLIKPYPKLFLGDKTALVYYNYTEKMNSDFVKGQTKIKSYTKIE